MIKRLVVTALSALLVCGFVTVAPAPMAAAQPSHEDQVFFDELEHQGLRPDYDKQICRSGRCASLRQTLVLEGRIICSALGRSPRVVPHSVTANLKLTPGEARAIINAARRAYCPQLPDPYSLIG